MPPVNYTPEQYEQLYLITRFYLRVGLNTEDLSVLLVILFHQWDHPGKPLYIISIARRLGRTPRFVQTRLRHLEAIHALFITSYQHSDGSSDANDYDLSPLFEAIADVRRNDPASFVRTVEVSDAE